MNKDIAIKLENVSKYYKIYHRARDRVKEAFSPFRKKYYKDFCAVKGVNLEIKKGEVLGMFGLNGAGKSTLLKMIAGVVTPSEGAIHVNGQINAMLELAGTLNSEMTGRENIEFNLSLNGIDKDKREQITKDIINFAEIGEYIDQPVKNYSSGMGARLSFGIATATKPEILIVDEVLAVGDSLFQSKCFIRVRELLKGGTTVVFVSHSVDMMIEFCDRAILLHNKEIVLDGDVKEIGNIYQKVMFSKNQAKVLDELQQKIKNRKDGEEIEIFDSNFDNSGEYENDFIKIRNTTIRNEQNKDICILETGQNYTFEFDIEFKENFKNISISFELYDITNKLLKTLSTYKDSSQICDANSGDTYRIINYFNNNLYYGQYTAKIIVENLDNINKPIDISINDALTRFASSAPTKYDGKLSINKTSKS